MEGNEKSLGNEDTKNRNTVISFPSNSHRGKCSHLNVTLLDLKLKE